MDNPKFKQFDDVLFTDEDGEQIVGMVFSVIPWAHAGFHTRQEYPDAKVFYKVEVDNGSRYLLPDYLVSPYVSVAKN